MTDPRRDRELAARSRERARRPAELGALVEDFHHSPEFAAMKRFTRVHGALAEVLPEIARGKVKVVSLRAGVLTLEVADGVLLAELRSTCARQLVTALAQSGTGASRLAWRVARRS
jgi:hypothetical protein